MRAIPYSGMSPAKYDRQPLQRAPLLEAVFEVRARCQTPYAFVPGELRLRLKDFPTAEESTWAKTPAEETPHHRFKSLDGTRLLQSGPNFFSAHVLGDYGEWDSFAKFLREGLDVCLDVMRPTKAVRTALRYINLLPSDLLEGLTAPVSVTLQLPADIGPVRQRAARAEIETAQGRLGLAIATPAEVSGGRAGHLLDLELALAKEQEFLVESILDWAKLAHDEIYQVFRACLSAELHERMRRSPTE